MTRHRLAAATVAALAALALYAAGRGVGRADAMAAVQAQLAAQWGQQWQAMTAGADAPASIQQATPEGNPSEAPKSSGPSPFTPPVWMPASVTRWGDLFATAGAEHGVDPVLLAIVATVESGGDPEASSGVAHGVMQIHPPSHDWFDRAREDEPAYSVAAGARILADNMRACAVPNDAPEYVETIRRAAARYNGGVCNAHTYKPESAAHVKWTVGMWRERNDATSPTYEAWLDAGGRRLVMGAAE